MNRLAVFWFVPNTQVGDGGPFRGTYFLDTNRTPLEIFDLWPEATVIDDGRVASNFQMNRHAVGVCKVENLGQFMRRLRALGEPV